MVQRRSYQTERERVCVSSSLTSMLSSEKAICRSLYCTIQGGAVQQSN